MSVRNCLDPPVYTNVVYFVSASKFTFQQQSCFSAELLFWGTVVHIVTCECVYVCMLLCAFVLHNSIKQIVDQTKKTLSSQGTSGWPDQLCPGANPCTQRSWRSPCRASCPSGTLWTMSAPGWGLWPEKRGGASSGKTRDPPGWSLSSSRGRMPSSTSLAELPTGSDPTSSWSSGPRHRSPSPSRPSKYFAKLQTMRCRCYNRPRPHWRFPAALAWRSSPPAVAEEFIFNTYAHSPNFLRIWKHTEGVRT